MNTNWNYTIEEAIKLQKELSSSVKIQPLGFLPKTVAGADISFNKYSETVYAGIVVLTYPELKLQAEYWTVAETKFPYVPGLLSFREIPSLHEVWEKIPEKPDLVILDGQGIAHPRRLGIASHFGLLVNKPTIGCGKSLLVGKYQEPALNKGAYSSLTDKGEVVGQVLRSKDKTNPLFVSPGHLITLEESREIVLNCCFKYRIPETTRLAHLLVNRIRQGESGQKLLDFSEKV